LRPGFVAKKVYDTGWSKVVKENHIRFVLQQEQTRITGIGFHLAQKMPILQSGKPFDIVFKIEENEWNGEKSLQLKVIDIRASE
jgi:single-stranded-DNA-specific exonuclease